jgi:hypothetical protein
LRNHRKVTSGHTRIGSTKIRVLSNSQLGFVGATLANMKHGGTQGNHNAAKTNRPAGLVVYNKPLKSQHVLFPKRTKRGAIDIDRYFA